MKYIVEQKGFKLLMDELGKIFVQEREIEKGFFSKTYVIIKEVRAPNRI